MTEDSYIHRIFSILDLFSLDRTDIGVREASRLLHISSSACGRLLSDLRDVGVLIQDSDTKLYRLGGRVMRWAGIYMNSSDLCAHALPYMRMLQRETRETISLYVIEGNERICVERLESHQNVRIVEAIGQRLKLYAGSGGRAILSFMDDDDIKRILALAAMELDVEVGSPTIQQIRAQLTAVREKGVALSHGEWLKEASGIAAPIFNGKGQPIGSISIAGPSMRFQDQTVIEDYIALLKPAMGKLSREMGYCSGVFIPE